MLGLPVRLLFGHALVSRHGASRPGAEFVEQRQGAVAARLPKSALDRLGEPLRDLAQRRGVGRGDEAADRLVAQIGVEQRLEMVVLDLTRAGGEGEQVVDRGGDLERSLVAVAHDAPQPFGVGRTAAHDAADLLLQRAHAREFGA